MKDQREEINKLTLDELIKMPHTRHLTVEQVLVVYGHLLTDEEKQTLKRYASGGEWRV